ncbi:MAG: long-chain fatty acid transport protein [Paracoccaceae bacterium]
MLATLLGANNGPGFGWKDMNILRLGAIYRSSPKLTLRGGISYASDFVDGNEVLLNTLAPATVKWHGSIGATYALNDRWSLSGAYTHTFKEHKTGANQTPGFGQPVDL